MLFEGRVGTWTLCQNGQATKQPSSLSSMPRTRSSKEDRRTPLEKLEQIDCKVDLLLFFNYYDGYLTEGMVGFNVNEGPPGSTKHRYGVFATAFTKNQFRSKGKKLAILAKKFVDDELTPPPELRPRLNGEDIENLRLKNHDGRTPIQKLCEVDDELELFIFFKYYDGFNSGGEVGFNPGSGPPGSINHKRSYASILAPMSESQFRNKGKMLGNLAKDFVESKITPPENLRPEQQERTTPWSMIHEALAGGF